jgi:hypothetical protein
MRTPNTTNQLNLVNILQTGSAIAQINAGVSLQTVKKSAT